eukprot:TRINITY_DN61_c0_g3_i2.p2 TRINITY_DN61_c0_g3~~TRINITY_DN61_c0_g3_i2.p2  ORF type:complete len:287 (+),score=98.09 TRINITY_DN61_c0_g3_i2:103-861(+)
MQMPFVVMGVAAPGIDLTPAELHMAAARAMEVVGGSAPKDEDDEGELTPDQLASGQMVVREKKAKRGTKKGVVKKGFMESCIGYVCGPDGVYLDCHAEDVDYRQLLEGGIVYYDQIPGSQTKNGVAKAVNVSGPGISPFGRTRGYVKRWMNDKQMGFIQPEAGGEEIVCYRDGVNCNGMLREGALVYYDVEDAQAVNVSGPGVTARPIGKGKGKGFKGDFKGKGFGGRGFQSAGAIGAPPQAGRGAPGFVPY